MNTRATRDKINVLQRCVADCEKAVIAHALLKTNGDLLQTAELLGISASLLVEKIKRYEMDCEQFK